MGRLHSEKNGWGTIFSKNDIRPFDARNEPPESQELHLGSGKESDNLQCELCIREGLPLQVVWNLKEAGFLPRTAKLGRFSLKEVDSPWWP